MSRKAAAMLEGHGTNHREEPESQATFWKVSYCDVGWRGNCRRAGAGCFSSKWGSTCVCRAWTKTAQFRFAQASFAHDETWRRLKNGGAGQESGSFAARRMTNEGVGSRSATDGRGVRRSTGSCRVERT